MIKKTATRIAVAVIVVGGLTIAQSLHRSELSVSSGIDPQPSPVPKFSVEWRQGQLELSGHTRSADHEQALLQVVETAFSGAPVNTAFQALGVVPDFWQDITVQTLYLLAETHSSRADISVDSIAIRGVVAEEFAWQSRLNAVRKTLPTSVSIVADTLVIDSGIEVSEICSRIFATLDPGPINFVESSTTLRNSAYPRLDRIVAVAAVCAESNIEITGHTDASGSETTNLRLSLNRANAVASYIERSGIAPERLITHGIGSAMPLADNHSRYGRSLNRRIEIKIRANNEQILVR